MIGKRKKEKKKEKKKKKKKQSPNFYQIFKNTKIVSSNINSIILLLVW